MRISVCKFRPAIVRETGPSIPAGFVSASHRAGDGAAPVREKTALREERAERAINFDGCMYSA
jgi:hypothetical protein